MPNNLMETLLISRLSPSTTWARPEIELDRLRLLRPRRELRSWGGDERSRCVAWPSGVRVPWGCMF